MANAGAVEFWYRQLYWYVAFVVILKRSVKLALAGAPLILAVMRWY